MLVKLVLVMKQLQKVKNSLMTKKGFPFLELFAIITLLSLVAAIAIPQIITTNTKVKENKFKSAVLETFTEALTRLDENIKYSKEPGTWDCEKFKYNDEYPFAKCIITWDQKDPTITNLKIDVTSKTNATWFYKDKTKEEIQAEKPDF